MPRIVRTAAELALLLVIIAGVAARIVGLPAYVADSGDEWGNALAPMRVLYNGGNPGTFLHPSLYYQLTALVYAALFGVVHALGIVDPTLSMADLFVLHQQWFVFAARAVSVLSAVLALWALYALGRALWDRLSGLTAAALLAVLPVHAVYSEAVRVDSLFVAVFLFAFGRIVHTGRHPSRAADDTAAVAVGIAGGANYNGALLLIWLAGAQLLRGPANGATMRTLTRSTLLAGAAFLIASPFVLLDAPSFAHAFLFQSGLALTPHPGIEGRGVFFYVTDFFASNPLLAVTIACSGLAVAVLGTRLERFVLSLPVAYLALFSLMLTKYDRFILPALALCLLIAGGLPFVLARRAGRAAGTASMLAGALLAANIAIMAPRAIPVPHSRQLESPDASLFSWIAAHVPARSRIVIESGVVPLIDTFDEPGPLADALRATLLRTQPGLDQEFTTANFIGGISHYDAVAVADQRVDFAIVSRRNVQYLSNQCDTYPAVCQFYQALAAHGRVVYETPDGVEPTLVFDLRRQ